MSKQSPNMIDVDIVIVGAGLVGTPLAHALAGQGWSVALLDAQSAATRQMPAHNLLEQRCTALSLGSQQWLSAQSLWPAIAADACAIRQVHVSQKGFFGVTRLKADELGVDALGYVVNNSMVSQVLQRALESTDVSFHAATRVNAVEIENECVRIKTDQQQFKARLLIAADGISSSIREAVGIETRQVDYEQAAVLSTLKIEKPHAHIAYERFTDSGPLALLPRPGPYMSFVDCINTEQRENLLALNDAQYLERLQCRFGHRLGRFEAIGPRFCTPLLRIEATRQVANRTVLMGNAMRLLHPVGGQGYNLALRDVASLQTVLGELSNVSGADAQTLDPGEDKVLSRFEDGRQKDQQRIVRMTDLLARGGRGQASLLAHGRALALIGLDNLSPLRKRFAQLSMGIAR